MRDAFIFSVVDALREEKLVKQASDTFTAMINEPNAYVLQQMGRAFLADMESENNLNADHLTERLKLNVVIVALIKKWVSPESKHHLDAEQRDLAAKIVQAGCEMKAPTEVILSEAARSSCLELQ